MSQKERFEAFVAADTSGFDEDDLMLGWYFWQEAERQMIERCAEEIESMPRYPDQYECAEAIRALNEPTKE